LISPNLAKYTCECSSLEQTSHKWKKGKNERKKKKENTGWTGI
jgi:hypothetical protein